eukprot:Nk52_evm11s2355 gene=Nk52_evmTU11s2355
MYGSFQIIFQSLIGEGVTVTRFPHKDTYVQAQQKRKAEAAESRKRRLELATAAFGDPVSECKKARKVIHECQFVGCYTGHRCSDNMYKLDLDPTKHRLVPVTKKFVNRIDRGSLKDESWRDIVRRVQAGELNVFVCSLHFEVEGLEFVNTKWGKNNPICEVVMKSKSYWERQGRTDLEFISYTGSQFQCSQIFA